MVSIVVVEALMLVVVVFAVLTLIIIGSRIKRRIKQ